MFLFRQKTARYGEGCYIPSSLFLKVPAEKMKLLIRNLDRSTKETDLCNLFESYGIVQSCSLLIDKGTGVSKDFVFVKMPKSGEAKAAISNLNAKEVDGKKIRVKKAEPKQATSAN